VPFRSRQNGVMSGALILTGAPGSGKSSVLDALSTLLEIDGVPFGAIESDELARGWPWLAPSEWLTQLAAAIALQREAGRENFLVVATTENEDELKAVVNAVAADRVVVICLSAPSDLVAKRVANREPDSWPGKAALIEHSRQLAHEIPRIPGIDVILPTNERNVNDVATEARTVLLTRGMLTLP
jgi:chloramphenicol 3-O-phosphotransferase